MEVNTELHRSYRDQKLPSRLFGTDRYPDNRVNVYSRPDILSFVHTQLKGSDAWNEIKKTTFAQLFDLPVTRCYMSCKLLHGLLSRQLVTNKKYEMWTVFGGQPLKFSLAEFSLITGLNCSEFPAHYDYDSKPRPIMGNGSAWERYICRGEKTRLSNVCDMLEGSSKMPTWRRVGLALLLIVDGVLIAEKQGNKRITPKYVNLLNNKDEFLSFPWGRESFLKTITSMIPTNEHQVTVLQRKLKQHSIALKGFPLSLQLLAFKRLPSLERRIPNSSDTNTITEVLFLPNVNNAALSSKTFLDVEEEKELEIVDIGGEIYDQIKASAIWKDEIEDANVSFMENLIKKGHCFKEQDWVGGDITLPIIPRRLGKLSNSTPMDEPSLQASTSTTPLAHSLTKKLKQANQSVGGGIIQADDAVHKAWMEGQIMKMQKAWESKCRVTNTRRMRNFRHLQKRLGICQVKGKTPHAETSANQTTVIDVGLLRPDSDLQIKLSGEQRMKGSKKRKTTYDSGIDTVEVSDGSPARITKPKTPSEMEVRLAKILTTQTDSPVWDILPTLNQSTYQLLENTLQIDPDREHITKSDFCFNNKFLLALAKPMEWVDTLHLEILMHMLGDHHSAILKQRRACFVTPMLVNHILSQQTRFTNAPDKSLFDWSPRIKSIVRTLGSVWLQDVDHVYLPVILADRHWVGLVLNLRSHNIEVLDTDVNLTTEAKLAKHLELLCISLPYIMENCCKLKHAIKVHSRPFVLSRTQGLYQSTRGGDCGPVSVKLIEMHAHGDALSSATSITNKIVDDLRKQYAMDIYKYYIAPLHV